MKINNRTIHQKGLRSNSHRTNATHLKYSKSPIPFEKQNTQNLFRLKDIIQNYNYNILKLDLIPESNDYDVIVIFLMCFLH